jgi:hypothetical protein
MDPELIKYPRQTGLSAQDWVGQSSVSLGGDGLPESRLGHAGHTLGLFVSLCFP